MLALIKKHAYQKARMKSPHQLFADKELIRELKDGSPFDSETHYAVIMNRSVYQGFQYGSMYFHNVLSFHEALIYECAFELTHICPFDIAPIPDAVEQWYSIHYDELRSKKK